MEREVELGEVAPLPPSLQELGEGLGGEGGWMCEGEGHLLDCLAGGGAGAQFADQEIEERSEGAGGEGDEEEGPGGEAACGGIVVHPDAEEEAGDGEVREELAAAPVVEVEGDEADVAEVHEGADGEGGEGEDDGDESEGACGHGPRMGGGVEGRQLLGR